MTHAGSWPWRWRGNGSDWLPPSPWGARRVDAVALTVPASLGADLRELIRGITEDLVTVLDLAALARDPRILIG